MDKEGQNEVTNHLRCAIKKKLSEISDFVDDELPEYIMILVANQRSKSQIEKDLSLFLRDDTASFTNWLWSLLNNINVSSKTSNSFTKSDSSVSKKKDSDVDEDAVVLDYDPDEHENELLSQEDTNDSVINKASNCTNPSVIKSEMKSIPGLEGKAQTSKVIENVKKEKVTEKKLPKSSISSETKTMRYQSKRDSKEQLSSKVVSVKRRYVNSDDEYDPSKPELVKSNSSRHFGGSTSFQANKLLLKAVDDATKSVLVGQNIEDFYKPTPIKVLSSRLRRSSSVKQDVDSGSDENQSGIATSSDIISQSIHKPGQQYPDVEVIDLYAPSSKGRTICLSNEPLMSDSPEFKLLDFDSKLPSEYSEIEDIQPKSPHFIVTMEGVSLNSFKRKLDDNSVDSIEDEEMEIDEMADDDSPSKKVKMSERCKYWPACKNSNDCLYHHPTTPCKCFPDCKYGDKCLYIHPNCKFDALCSRKDCPFTHASKRKLPLTIPVKVIPVKPRRAKVVCKYFPKCTMRNCPFVHPKLCRYGTECRLPSCMFSHLPIPARSQLKWQAPDL